MNQIKVQNARQHKISTIPKQLGKFVNVVCDALVTDAKLVLVECKNPSNDGLFMLNEKVWKPILISETEKLEFGDCVLFPKTKDDKDKPNIIGIVKEIKGTEAVITVNGLDIPVPLSYCKKILALPEHFSPQQLQDIVDGKLKEGKCLVECELSYRDNDPNNSIKDITVVRTNPHITIYPVEEKMVPLSLLEQAYEAGAESIDYNENIGWFRTQTFKDWSEQNVK